jgi:hypothetical protein
MAHRVLRTKGACPLFSLALCAFLLFTSSAYTQQATTKVGMTGRIEQLVLPGSELEAVPAEERKTPIVLRVAAVFPHGSAYRYDLEYYGLEVGTFDLKEYLRRKDGSSKADLPAITVKVQPLLPPGQVTPNPLEIHKAPSLGGYRTLQIVAGTAWAVGFLAIIYIGFLRRKRRDPSVRAKPRSLADRLRPLVEGAIAGQLSQPELANLERTLLAFWRQRLDLNRADPAEAIERLRCHPEAGPLLEQLEIWLHRPGPNVRVDPVHLLQPYQSLPPDALEDGTA